MEWIILAMAPSPEQGGSPFAVLVPLLGMLVIFYVILIYPQRKRQRQLQQMIDALRKGDRVMTTGGIYGTVAGIKDNIVILKIAENVKIEVLKSAIASLVEKGE